MALTAGARLGSYEIIRPIGAGGMGEVYLARDPRLNRQVALKLLPPDVAADPDRRARFEREARAAAALSHPNICTIFEVGEIHGQLFIAMEYLDGATLADCLKAGPAPMAIAEVVDIAIQIADALDEARKQHIVHRDLKSANIILLPRGQVKILDFGLAKQVTSGPGEATTVAGATDVGMVIGTAAYMSPEQALARPVDHRSDLFSFGVVLYELLTGRLPFAGRTGMELLNAIVNATPTAIPRFNEQVPDALVRIVNKLLAKDPGDRYQSAHDVVTDLRRSREEPGRFEDAATVASRRSGWLAAIAAGVLLAAAAGAWWLMHRSTSSASLPSVVVLPATVLGPPELEFFADGLPMKLTTYLAHIEGVDTRPPPKKGEVQSFKSSRDIAKALGVSSYVTASIAAGANGLSLDLLLTDTATDSVKSGQTYEFTRERYLQVLQQAADDLGRALVPARNRPSPEPAASPNDSEAELEYERGLAVADRYNSDHDSAQFASALGFFRHALALNPRLANAASAIAFHYEHAVEAGMPGAELELTKWANEAIRIDPRSAQAWAALGTAAWMRPQFDAHDTTVKALKAAAFAGPSDRDARALLGGYGSVPLAVAIANEQEVRRRHPLYLYGPVNLANSLFLNSQLHEAGPYVDEALAIEPGFWWALVTKTLIVSELGRSAEAEAAMARVRPLVTSGKVPEVIVLPAVAASAFARGDRQTAQGAATKAMTALADPTLPTMFHAGIVPQFVVVLARQGDVKDAVDLLELAARRGVNAPYDALRSDKRLTVLQGDPRFAALLEKSRAECLDLVGLMTQAKSAGELPGYLERPLQELRALLGR